MKKLSLIGKILILFKWFDIPITLFFVGILTVIGIFGSWVFVIVLIVLMVIGMVSSFVAILVGDYLDEQQTLKKNPYFKFFIVRSVWVGLFALVSISILKLIP
jgi:hypothetical protein